jgi:hypothetical protein
MSVIIRSNHERNPRAAIASVAGPTKHDRCRTRVVDVEELLLEALLASKNWTSSINGRS